jgi:acyl-CoA synthetase (AMP-forming)/AMP-acid ligase II
MAWNTWRHLESWYGILGMGAVYHTLNPRLFHDQIAWIMNDAEDGCCLSTSPSSSWSNDRSEGAKP